MNKAQRTKLWRLLTTPSIRLVLVEVCGLHKLWPVYEETYFDRTPRFRRFGPLGCVYVQ